MRLSLTSILLLLPASALAQAPPENLLRPTTQIYLRWDGVEAHRGAFAKTALGQMLAGDTGAFIQGAFQQLQDTARTLFTSQQILGGIPPDKLLKLQADANAAPKLFNQLTRHGVVIGVEVRGVEPPQAQFTLIVPDAGADLAPLRGTFRLLAALSELDVKEENIAGRTVHHAAAGPVRMACWAEGAHAVFVAGTDAPQAAVRFLDTRTTRLLDSPLFQKVRAFKDFETGARAFVDVASLVQLAKTRGGPVARLLDDLGVSAVKTWVFHSGFDGAAERSLVELSAPGPRKGLLRLLNSKPFTFADVPPIPPDVASWSMTNLDPAVFYDAGVEAAEHLVRLFSPDDLPRVKEYLKTADDAVGVAIRQDLLASLGDRFATYTSPVEGPFSLGQVFLFRVRDEQKLLRAVEQLAKGLGRLAGIDVAIQKKSYHGMEIREVHARQQGFFFVPTFAIRDGWFALSYMPQPVQGFLLRARGELPRWQPDAHVRAALDKMPRELVSVAVSDPRPTVRVILTYAPVVAGLIRSLAPEVKIDVGSVPNAHEATRHLFPNVTVVSDDGTTLRTEARTSLALPFDLGGADSYLLFAGLSFLGRAF